jgi:hypothetical protein
MEWVTTTLSSVFYKPLFLNRWNPRHWWDLPGDCWRSRKLGLPLVINTECPRKVNKVCIHFWDTLYSTKNVPNCKTLSSWKKQELYFLLRWDCLSFHFTECLVRRDMLKVENRYYKSSDSHYFWNQNLWLFLLNAMVTKRNFSILELHPFCTNPSEFLFSIKRQSPIQWN